MYYFNSLQGAQLPEGPEDIAAKDDEASADLQPAETTKSRQTDGPPDQVDVFYRPVKFLWSLRNSSWVLDPVWHLRWDYHCLKKRDVIGKVTLQRLNALH